VVDAGHEAEADDADADLGHGQRLLDARVGRCMLVASGASYFGGRYNRLEGRCGPSSPVVAFC
jgi:hypothetical protein